MNNNWKIAFRNFKHNKFYGLINIAGLTVGLTACFLILMYLRHELSYDEFLKDNDRIYQVALAASFGGDEYETSNTPPPVGETMQQEFPEIESYTRNFDPGDVLMRYEDRLFTESNIMLVDSNYLDFFSFELLEGDKNTCLNGTNSIVLTEAFAKKYFGDKAAVGKEIFMEDAPYTVTAVLKELPRESSLQFEALAPIAGSGRVKYFSWSWVWLQVDTYVKSSKVLNDKELDALESRFQGMVRIHAASAFKRIGQNLDEYFSAGNRWELSLKPLLDVHLYTPQLTSRLQTKGDIKDVYIFGTIGLFILFLACINFMNLSTARSMKRAKEVGVRKMLGSGRFSLITQFLSEAMLYSILAAGLAVAFVQIALPIFNQMMNLELVFSDLIKGWVLAGVILLPILTGLLAGSYPAFYLSAFNPISIIKNNLNSAKSSGKKLRSGLVVFQFAVSVGLVICTLIVLQQINFSVNGDLGMEKENVLIIRNLQYLGEKEKSFKNSLSNFQEVVQTSISTDLPSGDSFSDFYVPEINTNTPDVKKELTLSSYIVDADFIPTMGIELKEGRNFDERRGLDSLAIIINEATAKSVGWENPIGKRLTYPGGRNETYEVVGVMKDFHNFSFHQRIEPFAIFHESSNSYQLNQSYLVAKIKPGQSREAIEKAKNLWTAFVPDAPFGFSFLDDNINAQYQSDERLGTVLSAFTLLSIFVACLGLLGLIAFTTEQRTKEIGIRKVLGASIAGITFMLIRDLLKLMILSILIAIPVSWYFMDNWLMDFEYQIEMEWWIFALAGMVTVAVAFLTVSFQSIKAALTNPVDSLRND